MQPAPHQAPSPALPFRPFAVRSGRTATSVSLNVPATQFHLRHLAAVVERRDPASFLALFNYYAPRIKSYMKKLGSGDELAEELAQDAMLAVWRKAATYDPARSAVSSWIFTIARNLRIDALRREQRRGIDLSEPMLAPEPLQLPDRLLQTAQQERQLRAALATLPREQAAVVSLAFYGGKSHGEIAAELAIPLGTVKSRMRLAFQRIRQTLELDLRGPAAPMPAARCPARAAA